MARRMNGLRILTFTTLYPNSVMPNHGVFVENRLRPLVESGIVRARVIAPVPWFPLSSLQFRHYGKYARVPESEVRFDIPVLHPRYLQLPKIGMSIAPFLLCSAMLPVFKKVLHGGYDFDLIDAHYFYPDGVAAVMIGRSLGKPVSITARGTDINLIPGYMLPRQLIRWAGQNANGLITVSQALKMPLVELGIDGNRVRVLRNGVDLKLFRPIDRHAVRERLGLNRTTLLTVGHLIPRKGHDLVIRALELIPDVDLIVVGEGPEEGRLRKLVQYLHLGARVRFLGVIPHQAMCDIYGAADVLVLASSREGWANVLLEAMACGTPVAASRIWGTPEIVTAWEAGVLFDRRTPEAIAASVRSLLASPRSRELTRAYAERFSWEQTTQGQIMHFREMLGQTSAASNPQTAR